jgi:hypothetical protein
MQVVIIVGAGRNIFSEVSYCVSVETIAKLEDCQSIIDFREKHRKATGSTIES